MTDALKGQDLQTILPEGAQFASFLLQHPEHRIVAPLTEPALHLIHSGTVAEDGTVQIQENEALEQVTLPFLPTTQAEYQQLMAQLAEQRGYTWQGLVLKDGLVESRPPRDRPFVRAFVETQMFAAHADAVIAECCDEA